LTVYTRSAQLERFLYKPLANDRFGVRFPPSMHQSLEEGGSLSESANYMLPTSTTSLGNLSSLDITIDEELPTDPSNSSDTQEESECCLGEQTTQKWRQSVNYRNIRDDRRKTNIYKYYFFFKEIT